MAKKVVFIHGIAQTYTGAETLASSWYTALCDGFREANYPIINKTDFDMVFYGGIFRPKANYRTGGNLLRKPDDLNDWEANILEAWWREAARLSVLSQGRETDESAFIQSPDINSRARTSELVQRALIQLSKTRFFRYISSKDLLNVIHQVWAFLHDNDIKNKILQKVSEVVTPETKIIVAHSLGSVIAYEAICKFNYELEVFVTIGSPLGIRNLIFDRLTPCPISEKGCWPGRVSNWINIADNGDVVALQKQLAPLFGDVSDRLVYNGWHSHDVTRYLSSPILGKTLNELGI